MKRLALALLCVSCIAGCEMEPSLPATRNTTPSSSDVAAPNNTAHAPDNSGVNSRDRAPDAKTPLAQNENNPDVQMTADIRRRFIDKQFSINAQNAKIVTSKRQGHAAWPRQEPGRERRSPHHRHRCRRGWQRRQPA